MPLLDVPAFIAAAGIHTLEICHFHFPATDDAYLGELKAALAEAGVELANVLVDTGNLSNPDLTQWQADIAMTKSWQDIAARLGATGVRVDCGLEQPSPEAMKRSAMALRELADYGTGLGLVTATENWRATSQEPDDLLEIIRQADRPLKLCVDFGNAARTDDKYQTLAMLPYATSLHCKGIFEEGMLDRAEFQRCLSLAKEAGFDGYIALICDDGDEAWQKALILKQEVEAFFPEMRRSNQKRCEKDDTTSI
jgi:sugar phosphate isomerase/epimerase